MKRHPLSIAFDAFKEQCPELFRGTAEGIYLERRLNEAFQEGWQAAEREIEAALNHHREVTLSPSAREAGSSNADPTSPDGENKREHS